ncbi:Lactonase, 7-bladed beta-propeller-domain-containing protein [Schizophyllum commune]
MRPSFFTPSALTCVAAIASIARSSAHVHHVLVGNFGTNYNVTLMLDGTQHVGDGYLYTLAVDADRGTLQLLNSTSAASAHPWLSYDSNLRVLYASGWSNPIGGHRTYSAYAIQDDFTPLLLNTVPSCGTKPIANQFTPQIANGVFYGVDFVNPCGDVWSVKDNGAFDENIQIIAFEEGATLHGFADTADLQYMYVMDLGGNVVHTFRVDETNGTVTEIGTTAPIIEGAGPRHAVIHPSGNFMYVIDEEGLRVDQFMLNTTTAELTITNKTLAVTPFGLSPANASEYWGDEIALSSSGNVLYTSTRSRDATQPGFISGWSLTDAGDIDRDLFVVPTPEAGGTSNILTTSPWEDASKNMLILTDQDTGFVALYNLTDGGSLQLLDRVKWTDTPAISAAPARSDAPVTGGTQETPKKIFGLGHDSNYRGRAVNAYDYEQKYEADEYGEELGPHARFWRVLLDEARVYDHDMVEGWRDTLDVLLVFRAWATGGSINDVPQSTITLDFVTSTRFDYWCNTLWFISLALSLSTALMAVLVKQWLQAYHSNVSGTPQDQALSRQFRLLGIQRWNVPLIIGLLPMLLHASLLLFFVGLSLTPRGREAHAISLVEPQLMIEALTWVYDTSSNPSAKRVVLEAVSGLPADAEKLISHNVMLQETLVCLDQMLLARALELLLADAEKFDMTLLSPEPSHDMESRASVYSEEISFLARLVKVRLDNDQAWDYLDTMSRLAGLSVISTEARVDILYSYAGRTRTPSEAVLRRFLRFLSQLVVSVLRHPVSRESQVRLNDILQEMYNVTAECPDLLLTVVPEEDALAYIRPYMSSWMETGAYDAGLQLWSYMVEPFRSYIRALTSTVKAGNRRANVHYIMYHTDDDTTPPTSYLAWLLIFDFAFSTVKNVTWMHPCRLQTEEGRRRYRELRQVLAPGMEAAGLRMPSLIDGDEVANTDGVAAQETPVSTRANHVEQPAGSSSPRVVKDMAEAAPEDTMSKSTKKGAQERLKG